MSRLQPGEPPAVNWSRPGLIWKAGHLTYLWISRHILRTTRDILCYTTSRLVLWCLFGRKGISGNPGISFCQKGIPGYLEISHDMSISVYVGLCQDINVPMSVYLSISVDMKGYLKIWFLLCRYMSVYLWICQYEICHPWISQDILMQPGPGWAGWAAWKLRILHPAAPSESGAFVAVAWYTRSSRNKFIISGALAPPPPSSPPAGWRCLGGGGGGGHCLGGIGGLPSSQQVQVKEAGWCRPRALHYPQLRRRAPSAAAVGAAADGAAASVIVSSCCVAIDSLIGFVDGNILRCRAGLGGWSVALEVTFGGRHQGQIGYMESINQHNTGCCQTVRNAWTLSIYFSFIAT